MDELLRDALVGGVENAFFQLSDLSLPPPAEEGPKHMGERLQTSMFVGGAFPGRLHLEASRSLCHKVVGYLLPDEPCTEEMEQDVLGELLNMVAESARTLLSQSGLSLDVGPPEAGRWSERPDTVEPLEVPALGEFISLWLVPGETRKQSAGPLRNQLERLLTE